VVCVEVEKDEEDSSVTRPPELLKSIFASANLELFKVFVLQFRFPQD
jgi:hypothetical protein